MAQAAYTNRQADDMLRGQLEIERASFIPTFRDLNDYILPRRARFFVSDNNKGDRRTQKIIDSTQTFAAGTLRSGMMSGVTSPARPWFKLTTPDPRLLEATGVKQWLSDVETRMNTVFLRSNLYNVLPIIYGDMGVFGTACMIMEEDFKNVIRFYPFAIGSYMIANDARLKVNTFMRDFRLTVSQLIEKFGVKDDKGVVQNWENFSVQVKNCYERREMQTWIDVVHVIKPNLNYDDGKYDAKFKKFSSCYYERGASGYGSAPNQGWSGQASTDNTYLRESGYDFFPVLAPRWEITAEDAYGTSCPGVTALGDIKALQLMQKRKSEAIEKMVRPPMVGPSSLKNEKASILPGDITYVDTRNGEGGFKPAMEVRISLTELGLDIQATQQRISRAFYEDLFLMLANSDRRQITAREIDERHEEKLLALGPVLEQLNQDLLDPLIDNTFDIMMRQGLLPPPPQELQGMDLKVEYVSMMAQAQKSIGIASIERFSAFMGGLMAYSPNAMEKVNIDELVGSYADTVGLSPNIILSEDEVNQMRQQRAQQQQAMMAQQAVAQNAQTAKNLSQADTQGPNALTALMQQANAGNLTQ